MFTYKEQRLSISYLKELLEGRINTKPIREWFRIVLRDEIIELHCSILMMIFISFV